MSRRVVITGLGAVSGLGNGAQALWEGLVQGRSAIAPITQIDPSGFRCRLGSEASAFTGAKDYVPKSYRKAVKVMARDIELAVAAAKLAVEDAGLQTRGTLPEGSTEAPTYPPARMGCHIGAGLIAAETNELTLAFATAGTSAKAGNTGGGSGGGGAGVGGVGGGAGPALDLRIWGDATDAGGGGAMNNLPPLWLLKYLPNMLACHVTIIHGAEGPSNTITCAEASGLLSIGESVRIIERGDADLCFSGGAEAPINHMRLLRMELAGRLADTSASDGASGVLQPYDPASTGGLPGEGGGILILEELSTARARSARPYAEVIGYGAAHSTPALIGIEEAPMLDDGLQFAIENALEDAGILPEHIDAIIPHASGIPAMDRGELAALTAIFGERLPIIPLITLTPNIGDCLASAGGLAVAVGAMALRHQQLPARIHGSEPNSMVDAGAVEARPARLRHILVATGALGGQAAAVVLRAMDDDV